VEKLPRKKPPLTKKKLAGRDLSRFATPVDALRPIAKAEPQARGSIPDGLYSLDSGHPLCALFRVSNGGTVFERMSVDGWVRDDNTARHWWNPGSDWVVDVDRETAEKLAARFGRVL
jgi:hypothetical protein